MQHDHNPTSPSHAPTRWTEDRVEQLLLSLFAEQTPLVPSPASREDHPRFRSGLLVAVAAVCLAAFVPILSSRVDDDVSVENSRIARWVGPKSSATTSSIDLALSDEVEDSSEAANVGESDETAEAPGGAETDDSAST